MSEAPPTTVAAVDLGSNSFHMVVADSVHGQLRVLDRLRERVALAEGLGEDGELSPAAVERALDCLTRFGQRLRGLPPEAVRAVGTAALRRARSSRAFLRRASAALGFAIEVVAGHEEARLIYLGVSLDRAAVDERRLVVDIGGGSTEIIVGAGLEVLQLDSLSMGCVTWSQRFFGDGKLTREAMRAARLAAGRELLGIHARAAQLGWDVCLGASGTMQSIAGLLRRQGWSDGAITRGGLRELRRALVAAGRVEALALEGLSEDRRGVLAGGVAIASAVFKALELERMEPAAGAMREGVLHDLLGRIAHHDVREGTMRRMQSSWHVDIDHAARVEASAMALLEEVAASWDLAHPEQAHALSWAARLHELGLVVAWSGHHKHGAYITANADMPGFSRQDQELLAALIGAHRRRFAREPFDALGEELGPRARRLAVLLRLAVLFNRGRETTLPDLPHVEAKGERLTLRFPHGWLNRHPLTRADLEAEAVATAAAGVELRLTED